MQYCILNGEIIDRTEAKVDIEDRGYQFGDGIYEVIRIYNGKMFTATEHIKRLYESANKLNMSIALEKSELEALLQSLIEKNNVQLGIIYMQFTRGVYPRTHAFPDEEPTLSFTAYTKEMNRPLSELENGVAVLTTNDIRWLRCDIKSLNLLGNILAKQEAKDANCFEAIQHRDGIVTEGSSANVMIVKDNKIYTHEANNLILNGITRQKVIQLCRENNLSLIEQHFTVSELYEADEVFLTGTTTEVMPIIKVDDKQIGEGKCGKITKQLQELFEEAINSECGKKNI